MTYKRRYLCGVIAWLEFKTSFARLGIATRTAGNRTKPANALHPLLLVRMVQKMGLFDEWQAQKDSQYILAVDYLEQLAKRHDSTIEATANYLIHCDCLKEIYE